jgi:hypothetical protein
MILDPLLFKGGDNNLYRYGANNPGAQLDPLGLQVQPAQAPVIVYKVFKSCAIPIMCAAAKMICQSQDIGRKNGSFWYSGTTFKCGGKRLHPVYCKMENNKIFAACPAWKVTNTNKGKPFWRKKPWFYAEVWSLTTVWTPVLKTK